MALPSPVQRKEESEKLDSWGMWMAVVYVFKKAYVQIRMCTHTHMNTHKLPKEPMIRRRK